jgi:hypothetical protein
MAQEYEIIAFKVADYTDPQGNVWVEVAFKELGEPARWAMRPESVSKYHVGGTVFGHIEEATSRAGKRYNRFKIDKQDGAPPSTGNSSYTPKNNNTITLSMVWKTVAGIRGLPENKTEFEQFFLIVKEHFDELLLMSEQIDKPTPGYDQAKAVAKDIREGAARAFPPDEPLPEPPEEEFEP